MRWTRRAPLLLACVGLLALPGAAAAITIAPPGKAGASQYFETIPSSGGNVAPPTGAPKAPSTGTRALKGLGQGTTGDRRLARLGSDGAAAAGLAAATAPTPAPPSARPSTGATSSAGAGGSTASGVADVLGGSDAGGLGLALPLLLATALVAALGYAAGRMRGRREPPELSA